MHTTLTILSVPALAGALLLLDSLWPLSAHLALGCLAALLGVVLAAVIRFEVKKLK